MKNIVYGLIFGVLLSGCANQGLSHYHAEQVVEIDYGRVVSTSPYTFDSRADDAALIGGIEGALFSVDEGPEEMIAGAISGALISALFVKLEEGSRNGLLVDLHTTNNNFYSVVTKNTTIEPEQCLKVSRGFEVSLETVSTRYCERY